MEKPIQQPPTSKQESQIETNESVVPIVWAGEVPLVKQGNYADGLPYDKLNYLSFKLILKPNRFVSRDSFFDIVKVMKKTANELGCKFSKKGLTDTPVKIREVIFVDTPDFLLYNNGFILRRRICFESGFPAAEPEIVFKFRNPDLQKCAETDVRPVILGNYTAKFKCQALPLKEHLGGIRMLYSHNVEFTRSSIDHNDVFSFDAISQIFPVLKSLNKGEGQVIELVNDAIVEEVLQDIGVINFGSGIKAKVDIGIWRTRGEHLPLIAELAYQIKFEDRKKLKLEEMQRAERYFVALQYAIKDWISLDATKTGVVYRFLGNTPNSHE